MRYKQYLLAFILILIIILPVFGEQNKFLRDINYSLGTGLSYINGQYREIVYPETNSVNPYLSELLWNMDNVFLFNITAAAEYEQWSLNLSIGTAITSETGQMTDTDWLNYNSTNNTHWSLSKIWFDNSFVLQTNITYNLVLSKQISMPIGLGYQLNFWDWEDKVLDFDYPDPQPTDFIGENGIDYKIVQNIFSLSSGFLYTQGNITTGINLAFSPYVNAWDLDHHILRKLYFLDSFIANYWSRIEFSFSSRIGSNGKVSLTVFREELPEVTGDTYVYEEDISNSEKPGEFAGTINNGAGHASILWGICLAYIWTF